MLMNEGKRYNTRQRRIILNYLQSNNETPRTAAQISAHCASRGEAVGLTTIYRQLDRLLDEGLIKKITVEGIAGACYQFIGGAREDGASSAGSRFHLKCEDCGQLIDLECDYIDDLYSHISHEHQFAVDSLKTVLYGKCAGCSRAKTADKPEEKH